MNLFRQFGLCLLIFYQISAIATKNDSLRELAKSQTLPDLFSANQIAEQNEVLKNSCQKQLKEKDWPTRCFDWLEQQTLQNSMSIHKVKGWQNYLNRFCDYLAEKAVDSKPKPTSSIFWQHSRCAMLTKKLGLGFEK